MIKISKDERDYLEKHGCTFPDDLHHTYSKKNKTYYATENKKVKMLLSQLDAERKSGK